MVQLHSTAARPCTVAAARHCLSCQIIAKEKAGVTPGPFTHDSPKLKDFFVEDLLYLGINKESCSAEYKSVQGVALTGQHSLLARVQGGPASTTTGGDDLGASDGGGSCKQSVELSFSKSVRQDERPVLQPTAAKNDGGQNFINIARGLDAAHVDIGAIGASDSHWNSGKVSADMVGSPRIRPKLKRSSG